MKRARLADGRNQREHFGHGHDHDHDHDHGHGHGMSGMTMTCLTALLIAASAAVVGCDATRRDWSTCWQERCPADYYCTQEHRCVWSLDAGALDSRARVEVPPAGEVPVADAPAADLGGDLRLAPSVDTAVDGAVDATPEATQVDVAMRVDLAIDVTNDVTLDVTLDTFVPDAPGTCTSDDDCPAPGLPFCVTGLCVACKTGEQCQGNAPVCSAAHACVSCAGVDAGCSAATPACEADSGRCVECLADGDCKGASGKSFCVERACVGCGAAAADACAKRDPGKPACVAGGSCVECAADDDCSAATRPICDTTAHACKPCATDSECAGKPGGPGVCLSQPVSHCATDAETLYVSSSTGVCPPTGTGTGSATAPYCSLQIAVAAARSRLVPLILVTGSLTGGFTGVSLSAPLTVVGKQAVITPAPTEDGIGIMSGELTLRNLTLRGDLGTSTGIGIRVAATIGDSAVLHLDSCTVTDNPGGGILLNGAGFTLENTTVTRNGPNSTGWGGMQVQNLPAAGPAMLSRVTLSDNKQVGLTCSASLPSSLTVLAVGNVGGINISSTCGIVSCVAAGPDCGAHTLP